MPKDLISTDRTGTGNRLVDIVRSRPVASAAAFGAIAALTGLGAYYGKRRLATRQFNDIYDDVIEEQIHVGAIAY